MDITILKKMIAEPASKEWFKKYDSPRGKALHSASGKIQKKPVRYLSKEESQEKTKNWPKGESKEPNHLDYQRRVGRAYND